MIPPVQAVVASLVAGRPSCSTAGISVRSSQADMGWRPRFLASRRFWKVTSGGSSASQQRPLRASDRGRLTGLKCRSWSGTDRKAAWTLDGLGPLNVSATCPTTRNVTNDANRAKRETLLMLSISPSTDSLFLRAGRLSLSFSPSSKAWPCSRRCCSSSMVTPTDLGNTQLVRLGLITMARRGTGDRCHSVRRGKTNPSLDGLEATNVLSRILPRQPALAEGKPKLDRIVSEKYYPLGMEVSMATTSPQVKYHWGHTAWWRFTQAACC